MDEIIMRSLVVRFFLGGGLLFAVKSDVTELILDEANFDWIWLEREQTSRGKDEKTENRCDGSKTRLKIMEKNYFSRKNELVYKQKQRSCDHMENAIRSIGSFIQPIAMWVFFLISGISCIQQKVLMVLSNQKNI